MSEKGNERRGQHRYRIKNGVYAAYGPTFLRMGPLVDVSLTGFSYCYKPLSEIGDRPLPDTPDICLRIHDYYLDKIPYEIVYMVEHNTIESPGSDLYMIRYGIQFLDLKPSQKSMIKQLLSVNTAKMIQDRRQGRDRRTGRNRRKYDFPQYQCEWRQGLDRRKGKCRRKAF